MTRFTTSQVVSFAFAAVLTVVTVAGTNALADQQYRVTAASLAAPDVVALGVQHVVVTARRG